MRRGWKGFVLQRYVLSELVSPTIMGLAVFTFVLLATHLFRLMDLLLNRGVPFWLFAQFSWTLFPPMLILTIPMAVLVGVLLGVGRLAADNEIAAMRTSGVHLLRVFGPVLLAAFILTIALACASRNWVPMLAQFNATLLDKIKYIVAGSLEAGRVIQPETDTNVALYFRSRNPLTDGLEGITLMVDVRDPQTNRGKGEVVATARSGRMNPNPTSGTIDVVLTDGTALYFDWATSMPFYAAKFDESKWTLSLTKEEQARVGRLGRKPREMTVREIATALGDDKLHQSDAGALVAEIQQRRSIPLACVAFALLGIPLAIRVRPRGKGVALSIAFGLIFFYYVMLKWGVALCQNGSAAGQIIIFVPNVVVGGVGAFLFYRILRQ